MRAHFMPIDWVLLALYLLFLLVVGFWPRRQSAEEYLVAGRGLSLPLFVATLVATWYGGILGAGEFSYSYGLVAWTTNGLPYYIFALLFAFFLARRVRLGSARLYTIPDKLAEQYDRKTAMLGALLTFVYASPSTYVLMVGLLLHLIFGWPLFWAMIAGILFSIVYVFRGGFLSDVRVNTLQFLLMFTGFTTAAVLCLTRGGGWRTLTAPGRLPPAHLHFLGDPAQGQGPAYVAVWFFIALTTLIDPGFHQRCYAARTPRVAAVGIGVAVFCWFCFDLLTTTTGLFTRALLPHLPDAQLAYPALAERLMPPGIKGLFYVGMLAPIMASTVSYTFIAGMTIGRDFIWRLQGEKSDVNVPRDTRIGLAVASLFALGVALLVPSVVKQWYAFGNVIVPGLLLPLLGAYALDRRWKAPADFAFAAMLSGALVSLACLVYGWTHGGMDDPHYPLGLQPMYPGLLASLLLYGAGLLKSCFKPQARS